MLCNLFFARTNPIAIPGFGNICIITLYQYRISPQSFTCCAQLFFNRGLSGRCGSSTVNKVGSNLAGTGRNCLVWHLFLPVEILKNKKSAGNRIKLKKLNSISSF
jgi:hypothetical protein